jgi:hypothetical protein
VGVKNSVSKSPMSAHPQSRELNNETAVQDGGAGTAGVGGVRARCSTAGDSGEGAVVRGQALGRGRLPSGDV